MSNLINNREYRQDVLKSLIAQLHAGKSAEEVKGQFEETFANVSATEISEVEQALIRDGMPVSEVQRLCDVHAAVFKGSIEQIHAQGAPSHPADVFKRENRALEALIENDLLPHANSYAETGSTIALQALREDAKQLLKIDLHYSKKENLLFPYLEKYGITAPPKVMWGVDDEIRAQVKAFAVAAEGDPATVVEQAINAAPRIREMIFKEENILLPMALETLTDDEWADIAREYDEIGYCLIDEPANLPVVSVNPAAPEPAAAEQQTDSGTMAKGALRLPSGVLTLEEIIRIFDTLPFDVTFVDKNDTVKYFSQGAERIFPRTKSVIGRSVMNCHPPASVHIVEQIVADFKSGAKDHEDFWIHMGERYVFIRYYAVRGETGEYLGTLEVTQDIAPIQAIEGEKRLMNERPMQS